MAKVKDRAKPSIPPVAPGTYSAICVGSIDIGEQLVKYKDKSNYRDQERKRAHSQCNQAEGGVIHDSG